MEENVQLICATSKLFLSVLLPGSSQIAASYLPPQARLRAFTVGLRFRVQARLRPPADDHRQWWWRRWRQQQEEQQLRQTEKYEKNIHWQSCPQNTEKRLQTSQKKVRQVRPGNLIDTESLSFISPPFKRHQDVMCWLLFPIIHRRHFFCQRCQMISNYTISTITDFLSS